MLRLSSTVKIDGRGWPPAQEWRMFGDRVPVRFTTPCWPSRAEGVAMIKTPLSLPCIKLSKRQVIALRDGVLP